MLPMPPLIDADAAMLPYFTDASYAYMLMLLDIAMLFLRATLYDFR